MNSVRRNPSGKVNALVLVAVVGVIGATLLLTPRFCKDPTTLPIGQAQGEPQSIHCIGGVWYWIEQPKQGKARLVRGVVGNIRELATAEAITSMDADSTNIVWTERSQQGWSVQVANLDGSGSNDLWSGKEEPLGAKIAQGRAYWLQKTPAPLKTDLPFPALQPTLQVVSAPLSGGTPELGVTVPEAETGRVLGLHDNTLYLLAHRKTRPGSTTLYRIDTQTKAVERVAGTSQNLSALLTKEGILYWMTPSKETISPQPAVHVYRLNKEGKPESLSDWLPIGGQIYETNRGIVYVDRDYPTNMWAVGAEDAFPELIPTPKDYNPVAVGEGLVLLGTNASQRAKPALRQIPLP